MTSSSSGGHTQRHWLPWALIAPVLVLAGVVAIWPRDNAASQQPVGAVLQPTRPEPDLAAARARADLRPCPRPNSEAAASHALRGVMATCLGDGSLVDLGAALADRPTLINVWASWCQPCREELPVLDSYAGSAGSVQVIGVQVQSEPEDGLGLLASLGVRFPSVADTTGEVSVALRLPNYLPVSYVALADGTLRQVQPPTPFSSVDQVRTAVERYLGQSSTTSGAHSRGTSR